jgi:hypothetical protein
MKRVEKLAEKLTLVWNSATIIRKRGLVSPTPLVRHTLILGDREASFMPLHESF